MHPYAHLCICQIVRFRAENACRNQPTATRTSACLPLTGYLDIDMFWLARQEGKRSVADEPARPAMSEVHLQAVASTSARDGAALLADADDARHGSGGGGGHRVAFAGDTVLHVRAPRGHVTGMAAHGLKLCSMVLAWISACVMQHITGTGC